MTAEHGGDPIRELEDQMRAADALIEGLEAEVAELRQDLENASAALRAAQEEVAAKGESLEESNGLRERLSASENEARGFKRDLDALRRESADEQLKLRNDHIANMAALREELEEQRRADVAAATSTRKVNDLRAELRKERAAAEERHKTEIDQLKAAAESWEEELRQGYRELEERHTVEIDRLERERAEEVETLIAGHAGELQALERRHKREIEALRGEIGALTQDAEAQKIGLERDLREGLGHEREEELRAASERHASEIESLRSAAAGRELELQKQLKAEVEGRREEAEALRLESRASLAAAEEQRKAEVKRIKGVAEGREQELRRSQATRLAEDKEAAERRISALKAQREADLRSLRDTLTRELAEVRSGLEERLAASEERYMGMEMRREAEARAYTERLRVLEVARTAESRSAEEEHERWLLERSGGLTILERRVAELQDALEESGTREAELRERLESEGVPPVRSDGDGSGPARTAHAPNGDDGVSRRSDGDTPDDRLKREQAARLAAESRTEELERRLSEVQEESELRLAELRRAREGLEAASDPERRLRAGISLFNASEHTRTVASISKALGLPQVNVASGNGAGLRSKPVVTFVWGEMSWRRYVSDPTEGVEEPRVYLIGTGDDPTDLRDAHRQPNARMDARGRLILGVQAH